MKGKKKENGEKNEREMKSITFMIVEHEGVNHRKYTIQIQHTCNLISTVMIKGDIGSRFKENAIKSNGFTVHLCIRAYCIHVSQALLLIFQFPVT